MINTGLETHPGGFVPVARCGSSCGDEREVDFGGISPGLPFGFILWRCEGERFDGATCLRATHRQEGFFLP